MAKRFDRTDGDARGLNLCYRAIGDRLAEEASGLRTFLHENYYPEFGRVSGIKRRTILRRLQLWDDIFRDHAERLFRLCYEVEEKLVYSIAIDGRVEHRDLFATVRARRNSLDRLLRAINGHLRRFRETDPLDSETLYEFCTPVERAALFAQFIALTLFMPAGGRDQSLRDPKFIDIDWNEIERYAALYPEEVEAEVVQPKTERYSSRPYYPRDVTNRDMTRDAAREADEADRAEAARQSDVKQDFVKPDNDLSDLAAHRRRPPKGERVTLLRRLK